MLSAPDLDATRSLTRDEVLSRVRTLLTGEFGLDFVQTLPRARLQEDLDLDSIDLVALATRLEQELGLLVKENPLRSLRTVEDIAGFVFTLQTPGGATGHSE